MITVYHVPNSRSLRVVWLMEELGEEYRLEKLGFPVPDSFLGVNALGSVPAIDDDGIRMCQSLAILQYITGRRLVAGEKVAADLTTGPNPDPAAYAEHLQFLHFGEADLTAPLSAIFRTRFLAPDGQKTNVTTDDQLAQLTKRFAFLAKHMADGRPWVTGERFTIADISIGFPLGLANLMELDELLPAPLGDYWERLQSRPAYQQAIAK